MLTRRTLVRKALNASAGFAIASNAISLAAESASPTLRLGKGAPVDIPANFTGLGYEMSSVAPLGLLSPMNQRYVELIKGLGQEGVIRVGGIVADYTHYEPNGTILAERQNTVITQASLEQFAAFLEKIGWTAIWSVNFAQGTIDEAVQEAAAVAHVLGTRLLALEIGNEVESYGKGQHTFRPASYDYDTYRREYSEWHAAILKAVPGIPFAAPDTASSVEWVERMAADARGDVQLLTTHYYRNGQKRGSAEQLLLPDPRLIEVLSRLRISSKQSGIPWRMCETNSFSGGGRPGVSDTVLGALWTLDYMLLLAEYGCSGVNLETGVNQLGFISSYSPIQDDGQGLNTAGVPYYGMLAFATAIAGCRQILPIYFDSQRINLTAYILGNGGKPRSAVFVNRDSDHDVHVAVANLEMTNVVAMRLLSTTPDSKIGVTFGGSSIDREGKWNAKHKEHIRKGNLIIPRMSAVVLRSVD